MAFTFHTVPVFVIQLLFKTGTKSANVLSTSLLCAVEVGQCHFIVSEVRKHYGSCGAFEWKQSAVRARGGSATASHREAELIAPT